MKGRLLNVKINYKNKYIEETVSKIMIQNIKKNTFRHQKKYIESNNELNFNNQNLFYFYFPQSVRFCGSTAVN